MKREQHRYELKRKVLNVSRTLFLEKGYTQTTINEITKSAGITTGSLYHFFKGKQDILLQLTQEVFKGAATFADLMLKEKTDPSFRFSLEIGIQLYLMQKYPTVAELYLAAHESPDIARVIVTSAQVRNQKLFQSQCPEFTPEKFRVAALAVKGIFHSFIQETVNNGQNVSLPFIFRAIEMMLVIYHTPCENIEKNIQATHALIQKTPLKLFGFDIP